MENKNKQNKTHMSDRINAITNGMITEGRGEILSDILGSYTGTAQDGEAPEQDADDL